jgi:hypothetical protein
MKCFPDQSFMSRMHTPDASCPLTLVCSCVWCEVTAAYLSRVDSPFKSHSQLPLLPPSLCSLSNLLILIWLLREKIHWLAGRPWCLSAPRGNYNLSC